MNDDHFFLMIKPLYGRRESPWRRFLHFSETLRKGHFRQGRVEICSFRLEGPSDNAPICLLITYVDDLLIAYRRNGLSIFLKTISIYRTGGVGVFESGERVSIFRCRHRED